MNPTLTALGQKKMCVRLSVKDRVPALGERGYNWSLRSPSAGTIGRADPDAICLSSEAPIAPAPPIS